MRADDNFMADLWSYRDERELGVDIGRGVNLVGFDVVAADGRVGRVEEATYDEGRSYIVVDTASRRLGQQAVLPAGVIEQIDFQGRTILVGTTTDEIESAPEIVEGSLGVDAHLESIGAHYIRDEASDEPSPDARHVGVDQLSNLRAARAANESSDRRSAT